MLTQSESRLLPHNLLQWMAICLCATSVLILNVIQSQRNIKQHNVNINTNANINATTSKNLTRAVVHMGMHKTGTTSLQAYTNTYRQYLQKDGYEMPWGWAYDRHNGTDVKPMRNRPQFQGDFARCFLGDDVDRIFGNCRPKLLEYGVEIGEEGKHLFISAENFVALDLDHHNDDSNRNAIQQLRDYLSQWDEIKIIIYYRRFYDWIPSMHNEQMKIKTPTQREDIVTFLEKNYKEEYPHFGMWYHITAVPLLHRFKDYFLNDEITIRNYHLEKEDGKLVTRFFCDVLPHAKSTCDAIRQEEEKNTSSSSSSTSSKTNTRQPLEYNYLLEGARKAKLINYPPTQKRTEQNIVKKMSQYWESTLNFTIADFPTICPPRHILDAIWNITLYSENMLGKFFVEFDKELEKDKEDKEEGLSFHSLEVSNLDDIRLDFDNASRSSLCAIDVEKILKDERWKSFFKSFED